MNIKNAYKKEAIKYGFAILIVSICTIIGLPIREKFAANNLTMIYLAGVVIAAALLGVIPSIFSSVLSVLAFNFFFTKPYHSFEFYDPSYYFTLSLMLITSLIVGSMTARLSVLVEKSQKEEKETHALFDFSRQLTNTNDKAHMLEFSKSYIGNSIDCDIEFTKQISNSAQNSKLYKEQILSENGNDIYLIAKAKTKFSKSEIYLLKSFTGLLIGALKRVEANEKASFHEINSENEKLRNVLLSSLSHDLRTPLTIMNGTVSNLLKHRKILPREGVNDLTSLWHQLNRLQKFVTDLLRMAAISSNALKLNKDNYTIAEIIGAAILRLEPQKGNRKILNSISGEIPLLKLDGSLIEQVIFNLIDNAIEHTKDNGEIRIEISKNNKLVQILISDDGNGIPIGQEEKIFEKFNSKNTSFDQNSGGTGLGLAICKGIIEAHNGNISASNLLPPNRGAKFIIMLPFESDNNA